MDINTSNPSTNARGNVHPGAENNGGLPDFIVAMLRVGKLLTANSWEVREVTAKRISRIMERHKNDMPWIYKPKEICEKWEYYNCYIEGDGMKIEGAEVPIKYRSVPHYQFTFTKYPPAPTPNQAETEKGGKEPTI
jgi:hypothetical protein